MEIKKVTKNTLKFLMFDAPIVAAAALSSYDPTTAAVWAGATTFLSRMTPDEKDLFFDELFKQEVEDKLLNSLAFFRATSATLEAVSRTASEEKNTYAGEITALGYKQGACAGFRRV